jgi:transposase
MKKQNFQLETSLQKLLLEDSTDNLRPEYQRRLEIILRSKMGQSQSEICAAVGCSQQTARYWISVARKDKAQDCFNRPIGRPKKISEEYLKRLKELVASSPKNFGYSLERWTARWLSKHLLKELGISIGERHINRLLQQMGLSTRQTMASSNNWHKSIGIVIKDLEPLDR